MSVVAEVKTPTLILSEFWHDTKEKNWRKTKKIKQKTLKDDRCKNETRGIWESRKIKESLKEEKRGKLNKTEEIFGKLVEKNQRKLKNQGGLWKSWGKSNFFTLKVEYNSSIKEKYLFKNDEK